MNRWVFNGCMTVGLLAVGVGVGVEFGVGYGLGIFGLLLIGLTVFGARIASR